MCYHPWVGLDVSPQGDFKPCCKYKNVIASSFNEYAESQELSNLKKEFLEGKRPAGCQRCWRDEDAGLESKRLLDNKYLFDGASPNLNFIQVLSLPFGNTCNLACRICNSSSSSKWRDEAIKLQKEFPEIRIFNHSKFYDNRDFMDPIFEILPNVTHIDIPGGEPFVAKASKHLDLLHRLSNSIPGNVSIHYTTNLTKFPDDSFWEVWKKFKQVDIQLSIDGTHKQFEYNRWPANWNMCYQNIKKYLDKQQKYKNLKLSISHSVSVFTVFYLPEFLKWCRENDLPKPWLGLVSNPSHYNITVLPKNIKNLIESKFGGNEELAPIVAAMNATDNSAQFDTTLKYVKILDKHRQQDFAETFPEFYNLLDKTCQITYQQY